MDIHDLCGFIFSEVRTKLPRLQRSKQLSLSFEIACVASSIRTACLVDVFSPPDPTNFFHDFLQSLRAKKEYNSDSIIENITVVLDPTSGNSFFVNMPLLIAKVDRTTQTPKYVSLNDPPAFCTSPDAIIPLLTLLIQNTTKLPTVVHLPEGLGQTSLVPLAGFLLDYPVIYVPLNAEQMTYLPRVPLVVLAYVLDGVGQILKFSCPECLIGELVNDLSAFERRLKQSISAAGGESVRIERETCILDRVAL